MPSNQIAEAVGAARSAGRRRTLFERRRTVQVALLVLLAVDGLFGFLTLRPNGLSVKQQQAQLDQLNDELKTRKETVARQKAVERSLVESGKLGTEFIQTKFLPAATGFST